MTDLAITLAEAPDAALTDTNREYVKLNEHSVGKGGKEWELGLEKSTLIYQVYSYGPYSYAASTRHTPNRIYSYGLYGYGSSSRSTRAPSSPAITM